MPLEIDGAEVTISKRNDCHFMNLPCFVASLQIAFNLMSFSHSCICHMFLHRWGRGIVCLYVIFLLLFYLLPLQFFARMLANFKSTPTSVTIIRFTFILCCLFFPFKTVIGTIYLLWVFCFFPKMIEGN